MPQKWNLQDIRPANAQKSAPQRQATPRRAQGDIAPRIAQQKHYAQTPSSPDPDLANIKIVNGTSVKRKRMFTTIIVTVVLIALGIFVNLLIGGAEVTVIPKSKDITVQSNFIAHTEPQIQELGFELLSLTATAEKQVQAAGREEASQQASGKIFVYNTRTNASQRLITNTRFESPGGLIYRIRDSIEVPAATTNARGDVVPGSVVADVFADAPGESYNIAPARFTVPGLRGTDQYESVYAESTVAFSGGFEGERYIIDDSELQTAQQELHIELRNSLLSQMLEKLPAGFIMYPDSVTFLFESLPSTRYGDSLATIKEQAVLNVPIFKEDEFARYLAMKSIPEYKDEPVYVLTPNNLTFEYSDPLTFTTDLRSDSEIDFVLKGATTIVWKFDEDHLKKSLQGKERNQTSAIFAQYTSFARAQAELKPFWVKTFPNDLSKITIITVLE